MLKVLIEMKNLPNQKQEKEIKLETFYDYHNELAVIEEPNWWQTTLLRRIAIVFTNTKIRKYTLEMDLN